MNKFFLAALQDKRVHEEHVRVLAAHRVTLRRADGADGKKSGAFRAIRARNSMPVKCEYRVRNSEPWSRAEAAPAIRGRGPSASCLRPVAG